MSEPSDASTTSSSSTSGSSPFADLAAFVALPRISGLALSADGRRLAVAVQTLDREKTKWQSALWEVDPEGRRPARRLTRSAQGASPTAGPPSGAPAAASPAPAVPRPGAAPSPSPTATP